MRILIQYTTGQIQPLEIAGTVGIEIGGRMFMTKDLEKALLPKCHDHVFNGEDELEILEEKQ